jgi:hypothetical protein
MMLAMLLATSAKAGPFSPVVNDDEPAAMGTTGPIATVELSTRVSPSSHGQSADFATGSEIRSGRSGSSATHPRDATYSVAFRGPEAVEPDTYHGDSLGVPGHAPIHARVNYGPGFQTQILWYMQNGCAAGPTSLYTVWWSANAILDGRANAKRPAATGAHPRGNGPPLWDARDGHPLNRDYTNLLNGLISTCYTDFGADHRSVPIDELNTPIDLFEPRRKPNEDDEDADAASTSEGRTRLQPLASEDAKLLDPSLRDMWTFLRQDATPSNETRPETTHALTTTGDGDGQPIGVIQRAIRWALHNPVESGIIVALSSLLLAFVVRNPNRDQRAGA